MTRFRVSRRRQQLMLGFGFGLSVVVACGQSLPEEVFPELQGILHDAVTQSPRMLDQNLRRLEAEQQVLISRARLYPQVGASLTYNLQYESRGSGADWSFNSRYLGNVHASYPLLHWGAIRNEVAIAELRTVLADKGVTQAYRQLALEIRRAYLQAILDRATVARLQFADELARRRFSVLEQRVASGQAPASALGGARLGLDESRLTVDRAVRTAELSLRTLRRLSGRTELRGEELPDRIPEIPMLAASEVGDRGEAYALQDRFRSDHRFIELEGRLANEKRQLRIHAVSQRPKVDLSAGASVDQLTYLDDLGRRTAVEALYLGVRVSWNIFDGFATRGRLLTTRTHIRQLEEALRNVEEDLRLGVEQASSDVVLAARAMELAQGRFRSTVGSYELVESNVASNRASQDDLDSARVSRDDAEFRLFVARRDYLNAVAAWLYSLNADPAVPDPIPSALD